MKVVAINGSPRKEGNTSLLLGRILGKLAGSGIETEMIQLGGNLVHGCVACMQCMEKRNAKCAIDNDVMNHCISKMIEADGILLGSPTYFANMTTETKALIDRAGFVCRANGGLLRRKVGAAVVSVRRGGAVHVFNSINEFFLISEMMVVGSNYWNFAVGRMPGEVMQDEEGIKTMDVLAENMAWLLHKTVG